MSELVLCHICGEIAKYRVKQLCAKHYQRFKAHGDFETHERKAQVCVEPGCEQPVKAYGWCNKHWRRIQTKGSPSDAKWSRRGTDRCSVPGCGGEHRCMGLCDKHYNAERKRGHPLWRTPGRKRVHEDRPWEPETVVDYGRLSLAIEKIYEVHRGAANREDT